MGVEAARGVSKVWFGGVEERGSEAVSADGGALPRYCWAFLIGMRDDATRAVATGRLAWMYSE